MPIKRVNASIAAQLALSLVIHASMFDWGHSQNPSTPAVPTPGKTGDQASSLQNNTLQPSETTVVTTDPNQLVLSAIHQAVWGPPIACKVYQSSHAYGQQVIVSGDYKASGGGTGQFRHMARVSSGETTIDTIQVSDGRLMYTQIGADEAPRRVIVEQVRQALGNTLIHANQRPEITMHLAIGGQPELLRNLYHRYRWYKAVAGKLGGVEVWQLVGKLRTEPPKLMGSSPLDQKSVAPSPANSQVPEIVRLTLGRSASMAYFPYMVEYFQRTATLDDPPDTLEPVSKLVHTDATTSVALSEKDFVFKVQDNVERIDDETKLYMPPASVAGLPPAAAK